MTTTKNVNNFLFEHKKKNDETITHTRIADKNLNIYGGVYHISNEDKEEFDKSYYKSVIKNGVPEYLTEKQYEDEKSLIYVDLDFRYNVSVTKRLHNDNFCDDIVFAHIELMKKYYSFQENDAFNVYLMQRDNVRCCKDKNVTKDGIHLQIDVLMNRNLKKKYEMN